MSNYTINHLRELESEAIFVIREVAAQFEKPALLFSGGKDSILMTHLAKKAFYPSKIPFSLMHVDTGHNFPETIKFRDDLIKELGANLIVGSVQESIDEGRVAEEKGKNATRNALQITTLLDAIETIKQEEIRDLSYVGDQVQRIKRAKEIIITNYNNPPTLVELSQEVKLSLRKLKEGFKEVYGKPVFQYLLDYKMDLAKKMLNDGSYNVNEVSFELGYSTASHFISAFKKKYDITPKQYLKNNY